MAEQNLLKGAFYGRVGGMVGFKHRDKVAIRTTSNHIVHITRNQRRAVRAFEVLNRVSSIISKNLYRYMGLRSAKMLKHNQIAQLLKATVEGGAFDITKIGQTFAPSTLNAITNFTCDIATGVVEVAGTCGSQNPVAEGRHILMFIIDQAGHCLYSEMVLAEHFTHSFLFPLERGFTYYAVMLEVDTSQPRPRYCGFTFETQGALPVVVPPVIYFSRMRDVEYLPPYANILIANGKALTVQGNTLVYNP